MATTSPLRGAATALTFAAGDSTLASGAYAVSSAIDTTTLGSGSIAADDAVLTMSLSIAATAVANDVCYIWAVSSIDGTTYSDAPADASTDATHNPNMQLVDTLIVPSAAAQTLVTPLVSLAALFNGVLPPYLKIVVYNGSGAALTALAGTIQGINESIA